MTAEPSNPITPGDFEELYASCLDGCRCKDCGTAFHVLEASKELAQLRLRLNQYEADYRAAATTFRVPVPQPGTDAAKLLIDARLSRYRAAESEERLKINQTKLEQHADECYRVQSDLAQLRSLVGSLYIEDITESETMDQINEILDDISSWLDASRFTPEGSMSVAVKPEEEKEES